MKLPNNTSVSIQKEKLINYILSETHPVGKFKAKYFRSLGFDENNVDVFEKILRLHAMSEEVKEIYESAFGIKYILEGTIKSPTGKSASIVSVWIIETFRQKPRFITIYPA